MELFWTPEAIQDRIEIYDRIEADSPAAALAMDELFSECATRLRAYPGLGRTGRVAGTRELVLHPNYVLVYDLSGDYLRVLRLMHAVRRWPQTK